MKHSSKNDSQLTQFTKTIEAVINSNRVQGTNTCDFQLAIFYVHMHHVQFSRYQWLISQLLAVSFLHMQTHVRSSLPPLLLQCSFNHSSCTYGSHHCFHMLCEPQQSSRTTYFTLPCTDLGNLAMINVLSLKIHTR